MKVTSQINVAKDDLDLAIGEVQRAILLLELTDGSFVQEIASLDMVKAKLLKVRASL